VLVPGAGLGRLCVDIAAQGFEVQGNEFSYFMLVTASFLLNNLVVPEQWTLHPWLHINVNNVTDADQLRPVSIPDMVPREVVRPGLLSMCAGDCAVGDTGVWGVAGVWRVCMRLGPAHMTAMSCRGQVPLVVACVCSCMLSPMRMLMLLRRRRLPLCPCAGGIRPARDGGAL